MIWEARVGRKRYFSVRCPAIEQGLLLVWPDWDTRLYIHTKKDFVIIGPPEMQFNAKPLASQEYAEVMAPRAPDPGMYALDPNRVSDPDADRRRREADKKAERMMAMGMTGVTFHRAP